MIRTLILSAVIFGTMSCTTRIVIVDRATLMETEAAGEWPSLEEPVQKDGPEVMLNEKKKSKAFTMLRGEG